VRSGIESVKPAGIEFVFEDEGCGSNSSYTLSAFKKLSEFNHFRFFIGPGCGSPQELVAPFFKHSRMFNLLPSSASRQVFQRSGGRIFSAQFSIENEDLFLANELYRRGYKKAMIIMPENYFSTAHQNGFTAAYRGEIMAVSLMQSNNDLAGLRAALLKAKFLKPQLLFVPDAAPFLLGLMRERRTYGISNIAVASIYSVQSPEVLNANGGDADGLLYSYPDIGAEDALIYYPRLAAQLLSAAVLKCKGDPACVLADFKNQPGFDQYGAYKAGLKMRTVQGGQFVELK
jgi:hypothetical protein